MGRVGRWGGGVEGHMDCTGVGQHVILIWRHLICILYVLPQLFARCDHGLTPHHTKNQATGDPSCYLGLTQTVS